MLCLYFKICCEVGIWPIVPWTVQKLVLISRIYFSLALGTRWTMSASSFDSIFTKLPVFVEFYAARVMWTLSIPMCDCVKNEILNLVEYAHRFMKTVLITKIFPLDKSSRAFTSILLGNKELIYSCCSQWISKSAAKFVNVTKCQQTMKLPRQQWCEVR